MTQYDMCWCIVDFDAIELVDTMLPPIIQMLGSCKVSVYGRDNIMELLIKFVTRKDGVGWSKKFIEAQGFVCLYLMTVEMLNNFCLGFAWIC